MGLENIKHTPIRYSRIRKRPYFSSILKSTENLLKSCIEEKKKLLNKMKAGSPNIKDIVDCMLLCYLWPGLKLIHVNICKNKYKRIIETQQEQVYEEIKGIAQTLATDNNKNGSKSALIHAAQSPPRVGLLCKELENNSKDSNSNKIDLSIDKNMRVWGELSSCGNLIEWVILKKVFKINDIVDSSLSACCNEQIKKFLNDSSEGIGYFKKLCGTLNQIAAGRIQIAELAHKKNNKSKTTNEGEENSKHSKFRMLNICRRSSSSKTTTAGKEISTSKCKKSSTNKKSSKNIKSRLSNMWKRLSGSRNKTKN